MKLLSGSPLTDKSQTMLVSLEWTERLDKRPTDRTSDDLDIIFSKLKDLKAFEKFHPLLIQQLCYYSYFENLEKGVTLFRTGDLGANWFAILSGNVDVCVPSENGKGHTLICSLGAGAAFGESILYDTPRNATIITSSSVMLLRVEQKDFKILWERNKQYLHGVITSLSQLTNTLGKQFTINNNKNKENHMESIYLDPKRRTSEFDPSLIPQVASTKFLKDDPTEKMLEYFLETYLCVNYEEGDTSLDDFLSTYVIFMPIHQICTHLISIYKAKPQQRFGENIDLVLKEKVKVIRFILEWYDASRETFFEDSKINHFLDELYHLILVDMKIYPQLKEEIKLIKAIIDNDTEYKEMRLSKLPWKQRNNIDKSKMIRPSDEVIFKVYCADHTYTTMKMRIDTPASKIIRVAADKLGLRSDQPDDLKLCEVKSTGERILYKESDLSISYGLSLDGRLFLAPSDHLDALVPLPEQSSLSRGTWQKLEMFGSKELAYAITMRDYDLFMSINQYELLYQVFGRYKFGKITANLDRFMRRFNEIQYWVVTEICLTPSSGKRVQLLRKFIKIASYCKEFRNLNSFFAIMMGLSNIAVSRLSLTWERLPSKIKRMFSEFETLMDPSRNHRVYRSTLTKLTAPIILFMPLLIKDLTFIHEGSKTYLNEGLVNFEKMRMLSHTMRTMKICRSQALHFIL
ncbi:unnamed protein product [Rotaria sp. Silwood1]|nr:unnamed protein product [Rotaria sp. Silwood1]